MPHPLFYTCLIIKFSIIRFCLYDAWCCWFCFGYLNFQPAWRNVQITISSVNLFGRFGYRMSGTICGKGKEVAWWMASHGRFPRVLNVLPREKIEGPLRDFLRWTQGHIQGQTKGQGFAFRKSQRGPSIFFQREYIEYSRDLPMAPFTMIRPRLSHRFLFFLSNAQTNKLVFQWDPRE